MALFNKKKNPPSEPAQNGPSESDQNPPSSAGPEMVPPGVPAPGPAVEPPILNGKTGAAKSAHLLLSLPKEEAANIISLLDDESLQRVVAEMAQIQSISGQEKTAILTYFQRRIKEDPPSLTASGGMETARTILNGAFGTEKAGEIIDKFSATDSKKVFEQFNAVENNVLTNLLLSEHPQTIAIALANLIPKKSAEILKSLPPDLQTQVAKRLAKTTHIHPEAVIQLAQVLSKKLDAHRQSEFTQGGGVDSLANILNHLDRGVEDKILQGLGEEDEDLVQELREKLFTFEELGNLSIKELRLVIAEIPDDRILATALRGAGETIRRAFFAAMSQNRASDIIDEMNLQGPTPTREINDARKTVMDIAQKLDEVHEIVLKKEHEDYI